MTAHAAALSHARSVRRWPRRPLGLLTVAAAVLGLSGAVADVAAASPTPASGGEFVPMAATRLVNSAAGKGWTGKLQPNTTKTVTASGVAGVPATNVLAVMLHITTSGVAAGTSHYGNLWSWPAGALRPTYATVANAPAGASADNTAIVHLGRAGQISFYNGAQSTAVNVIVDVEGYVTATGTTRAGATFAPLAPSRIIDTTTGIGGQTGKLTVGEQWDFHPLGVGGIPSSNVAAVVLNLGAQGASTNCWVQAQPTGTPAADASYPRVAAYRRYASQQLAVVAPDAMNGSITLSTTCSAVNVFADVEGYYLASTDGSSGDVYVPVAAPTRVIDTSQNIGVTGKMTAGRMVGGASAVPVSGVGGIPLTADAVALNVGTLHGTAMGSNTIWTDGSPQPTNTSTVNVDPRIAESNLAFVATGPNHAVDIAATSADPSESNDLYADIEGYFYHSGTTDSGFGTPQYFSTINGDTYYNTVGASGDIITTGNDTRGVNSDCIQQGGTYGANVAIYDVSGDDPSQLSVHTVNCMRSFGRLAGAGPDNCTWKSGGITRVGQSIYLAVARQGRWCGDGQGTGLQASFNASIMRSDDDGVTWTNPWHVTSTDGAAPVWRPSLHRYQAMFPRQTFPAPFFIQYGRGNTNTVDGGDSYVYSVSTDGDAYNGSNLRLARVPVGQIQNGNAWQYYHGPIGGDGLNPQNWTSSAGDATHVLTAAHRLSQPAIQYVPALGKYVMTTFYFAEDPSQFRTSSFNPYTRFEIFEASKPWGRWTLTYEHSSQRSMWCTADPCQLISQPGSQVIDVGTADQWTGYYDPSLVQKFAYGPLNSQMLFVNGDWLTKYRYTGENLYSLHGIPVDLGALASP